MPGNECYGRETMTEQRPGLTRRVLLGAALTMPALISARAQSKLGITDELVKAAQKEGALSYYHNSDIGPTGQWTEIFAKKFGIQMKNMRLPSYPLFDRWLNESRVGRHLADLIQITDPTLLSYADRLGFVAHYTPEGGAAIPAHLQQDGTWYGLFTHPTGIGHNAQWGHPKKESVYQTRAR